MKRLLVIMCLLFSFSGQMRASHIFGGELYYTYVNDTTYVLTLTMYGDCAGQAFPNLYNMVPVINVMKGGNHLFNVSLGLDNASVGEVTPVCKEKKDSTQCRIGGSTIIGVTRFIYTDTVVLPGKAPDYRFIFHGNSSGAGRTMNITNIVTPGSSQIYLVSELDNTSPNSSAKFTTIPTPYYCINVPQEYNQGAIDADGDSLVFELAPALQGGNPVVYIPGYSPLEPVSTNGLFYFNELNGQMNFTPDKVQNSVVVNKVYEYRNGVVVGTSMREMTFIVVNNCNNQPPSGALDTSSVTGAVSVPGNVFNVCPGTPEVSFNYPLSDPDGDTLDVSVLGVPAGASLNITGNGTPAPVLQFSWNTTGVPKGVYTFYVTTRDRHCPLSIVSTKGFTIRVVGAGDAVHSVMSPTRCAYRSVIRFDISEGLVPRTLRLMQGSSLVKTHIDTSGVWIDSLLAGDYRLIISSPDLLCFAEYHFTVVDSGSYPHAPVFNDLFLCTGDKETPLTVLLHPEAIVHWYDSLGMPLGEAPVPQTDVAGKGFWLVSQQLKVCESQRDTLRVTVSPKPDVKVLSSTGAACMGDKVRLSASGALVYRWLPETSIFYEPDSTPFIRVYQPAEYAVIGTTGSGCQDTASFSFTSIERCCMFSYPDAFTPNGDGHNERWRPVAYGNQDYYELSIYNRWGIQMFHSFHANEGWDGRYRGEVQDIGTYHYILKAKCVTGREEQHKGEFTLIR